MQQRIELAPNCSLDPAAALRYFLSICGLSLLVALTCALRGFWPVLPFWALEMLALGLALKIALQRRFDKQTLLVTDDLVSLVTRSRRGETKEEFARHWAKVRLRNSHTRPHTSRLTIESRGRAMEVGAFLTEDERRKLASRLRAIVGGMNESPPLEFDSTLGDSLR